MKHKPEMQKYETKSGHPYAIQEQALDLLFEVNRDRSNRVEDGIGILTVYGPLDHHASGSFDNYDSIIERYEELLDNEDVLAVAFAFDSPGGDAYGMIEARKTILKLREQKPTYAYSNESCFSAAYGLASACSEIWVPQTGGVGSVGVVRPMRDESEAFKRAGVKMYYVSTPPGKALGRPGLPVDDATLSRIQAEVDQFGELFFKGVSRARGISINDIHRLQANVFHGKKAIKAGLADGVAGWDEFLDMIRLAHGGMPTGKSPITRSSSDKVQEPTDMKAKKAAATLLALMGEKTKCLTALAASKNTEERVKLAGNLDKLIAEISAASTQAAYKKTKKVEETEEQTDDEEDEESAEEEEEEERCDDEDDDDDESSDGGSSDGGSDSSMSTDAEEKSSKAFLKATTGLQTPARLLRLCRQVTGKNDIGEVFGALDAMGIRLKSAAKTEKRVAKLEMTNVRTKVTALLNKAVADGRVTPAQLTALKEQGMKDYSWLKGYVATLPKAVRQDSEEVQYDLSQTRAPSMADQVSMLGGSNVRQTDQEKILSVATSSLSEAEGKMFTSIQSKAVEKANGIFNPSKVGPRH